nr:hypothetical protein Cry52Nrm2_p021 [Cryptomonas curvata]
MKKYFSKIEKKSIDCIYLKKLIKNVIGLGLSGNKITDNISVFITSCGVLKIINKYIRIFNLIYKNEFFIGDLIFIRNKDINLSKDIKKIKAENTDYNEENIALENKKYIIDKANPQFLNWIQDFNSPLFGYLFSNFKQKPQTELILIVEKNFNTLFGLFFNSRYKLTTHKIIQIKTNANIFRLYTSKNCNKFLYFLNRDCFLKEIKILQRLRNIIQIFSIEHTMNRIKKLPKIYNFSIRSSLFIYRPDIKFKIEIA